VTTTRNAGDDRAAATGSTQPAWLTPQYPLLRPSIPGWLASQVSAALASAARSSSELTRQSPVDDPVPRLS
jgi:hypothetical protein